MPTPRPLLRLLARPNARPSLQPLIRLSCLTTTGPTTVQQRRPYAKPRVRRAPTLEPVSAYPLEKWVEVAKSYGWKEVDPAFFRKCFISWHDAYQSGGTDEQYNRVMQEHGMTVKHLHHLAIYTNCVFRGPSNQTDIYMHLVRSMLGRASALGHEASTLTAISLSMTMENQLLDVTDNPRSVTAYTDLPDEVHERFAAIVELGDVPDALVLSGRLALNRGDPVRAAEMFRKAEAVGKEQKQAGGGVVGSYELRGMCLADLGTALMKLGDEEAAMKCFVEAAEKYNMASAWQQLAYGGHCDKGVMTWTQDLLRGADLKTAWRRVTEGYDNMAANALERGDKDMFMDCQILASEFRKASKAETVGEE